MKTRAELEQENARIAGELAHTRTQLLHRESRHQADIKSKDASLRSKDAFIEQLKEALILARNRQFAKATESLRSLQSELFNEPEQEALVDEAAFADLDDDTIDVPAHQRKRSGRKKLPEDLPRIQVIHDLSDADKTCPQGHALKEIGEKISEQLDVIPMQIQVIQHVRKQYVCPCCDGFLKTATKPKQAIEKSQASAGLLAYIAVSKYADSLPLYRQSSILARFGIEMNRTTLAIG